MKFRTSINWPLALFTACFPFLLASSQESSAQSLSPSAPSPPKGILFIDDQDLGDDFVVALPFRKIEVHSVSMTIRTQSGKRILVPNYHIRRVFDLITLPEITASNDGLAGVEQLQLELKRLEAKYPRSAKGLDPFNRWLASAASRMEQGLVLVDGHWVPSTPTPDSPPPPEPRKPVIGFTDPEELATKLDLHLRLLKQPDPSSCGTVVKGLNQLCENLSVDDAFPIRRLARALQELNARDLQTTQLHQEQVIAEREAAKEDARAAEWMKPNAFGNVNEAGAKAAEKRAAELRAQAASQLFTSQALLRNSMNLVDLQLKLAHRDGRAERAQTLHTYLTSINERNLGSQPLELSVTEEQLKEMVVGEPK